MHKPIASKLRYKPFHEAVWIFLYEGRIRDGRFM